MTTFILPVVSEKEEVEFVMGWMDGHPSPVGPSDQEVTLTHFWANAGALEPALALWGS